MNPEDLFARAVAEFDRRVNAVGDDQWGDPTPCTDWKVCDLVNHIVYEARWMPELLAGKSIEEVGGRFDGGRFDGGRFDGDLLGDDATEAWRAARDAELNALESADAFDKKVHVSWGQIPAREYLDQLLMDHVVHGWDLARAVGADEKLDSELVDHCYAGAKRHEADIRGSGVYGDEVAIEDGADTQTKLLALLGREA